MFLLLLGLWTLCFGVSTSASAQSTNSNVSKTDYRNFEVIAKKNIFNPRRSPAYVAPERPQTVRRRTETLALVGVMSYGKGPVAFFDGSRSDYQKVLKPNDNIAGFKVAAIDSSSVKLAASTNEIELQLGMQLTREEAGDWKLAVRPESLDTYARATPMRSSAQVNAERDSESDQNANNPFGAIGNFFANGGFRGNGFPVPGGFNQPTATPTTPTPPAVTAAPAESTDTILQRLAQRRQQETGEGSQSDQRGPVSGPGTAPSPTPRGPNQQPLPNQEPLPNQQPPNEQLPPGQLELPNQPAEPLPDQGAEVPQNQLPEQPPNQSP